MPVASTTTKREPVEGETPRPSALLRPLDDSAALVALIARVTERPEDEVRRRLLDEERAQGTNVLAAAREVGVTPFTWTEAMGRLYDTDAYVYDSAAWNRKTLKLKIREWIGDYLARIHPDGADVLMFGDGLGFDAAYLALRGNRVLFHEVSKVCIDFAEHVFRDNAAKVTIESDPESLQPESFDAITCLDVLEHVPDPIGVVAMLAKLLRPGGRLIVSAPYFLLHELNAISHLRSNARYCGDLKRLYEANGLRLVDGRTGWDPVVLCKCEPGDLPADSRWGRRLRLRISGSVLATGRFWTTPLAAIARRMLRAEPRWVEQLERMAE